MKIIAITLARQSQFSPIFDLLRRDHDLTLLAPEGTGEAPSLRVLPFVPIRPGGGSPVERVKAAFLGTACAVAEALRPLRQERFDVVFGQASFGCTYDARSILDTAVVSHVELPGLEMKMARPEFPPSSEERSAHDVQRSLVCVSLQTSDLVITPSHYARSLLPQDLQPRVRVCMEGFPLAPFRGAAERTALRRRHGLPEGTPILGYFGRTLEAVRGFDIFVQTAREVRRTLPHAAFLVVGEPVTYYGNEQNALGRESFKAFSLRCAGISEGDFLFRPLQPLAVFRELVAAVDAAVFPIFESAGNWSFFECLAVGTPAVAAQRCFFPEVIVDGENGFLCKVWDIAAFADRCVALLVDPALRERIGRAGWETVRRDFTAERAAERYHAAFVEAAQRAGHPPPG